MSSWQSARRSGTAWAACALLGSVAAPAQTPPRDSVAGRVTQVTAGDTLPVSGVRVVLHRVGRVAQGPLDSVLSDPRGRFRFTFRPDSAAVYLLSARYRGIEYFSDPVGVEAGPGITLLVSDTSAAAPLVLEARYLLVGGADDPAGRSVLDVFVLRNDGPFTRVAPDSTSPIWLTVLPHTPEPPRVEDGTEISTAAIAVRNDTLRVFAPFAPGRRQIVLSHTVPLAATRFDVPVAEAALEVTVLAEDSRTGVRGGGLRLVQPQVVEGRPVRRWSGPARAGDRIEIALPRAGTGSSTVLALLVALAGAAFAAAVGLANRRRRARAPRPVREDEGSLLDQLARLDAEFQGRDGEVPRERWRDYRQRRQALKARLAAALAARGRPS